MFTEVASGVFSVAQDYVDNKNGIVYGSRCALAIDGGNAPQDGQAMADHIDRLGFAPDRLVLTHGHGDHILGAGALAGGEVFAHALTAAVIRRQIPGWAARWDISAAQVEAQLVWPTVTFSDELRLDLGGKTVHLFPTPGHSEDGISAFVEEDRVLFGGDSVVTGIVAAIGDGDSRVLERSLYRLAQMDIAVLVPGHGPVLYGAAQSRDWILWEADYLAAVRRRVRQGLDQGVDPAAVAAAVDFAEFIGDRLPAERHNMPGRHHNTVEKIIAEETQEK
jgi:cyclase